MALDRSSKIDAGARSAVRKRHRRWFLARAGLTTQGADVTLFRGMEVMSVLFFFDDGIWSSGKGYDVLFIRARSAVTATICDHSVGLGRAGLKVEMAAESELEVDEGIGLCWGQNDQCQQGRPEQRDGPPGAP